MIHPRKPPLANPRARLRHRHLSSFTRQSGVAGIRFPLSTWRHRGDVRQSQSNCSVCSALTEPHVPVPRAALITIPHAVMQAPPRRQSPAPKAAACPHPHPHPHPHLHLHLHLHPRPPPSPLPRPHAAGPHSPPRCADALPRPSTSERDPSAPPPPPRTAACCQLGCADAPTPPGPRSRAGSRRWDCSLQGAVPKHVSNVL
jgi:hypothetical protein